MPGASVSSDRSKGGEGMVRAGVEEGGDRVTDSLEEACSLLARKTTQQLAGWPGRQWTADACGVVGAADGVVGLAGKEES
jgi:hypothetical protein